MGSEDGAKLSPKSFSGSAPSLASSSKLNISRPTSPTKEEILAELFDKAKFYTSVCLGTTAILSVFAFLFLIPFVVDPAISTIVADYDQVPVTCIISQHIIGEGLRNCSWSSCREGCTNGPTRCHQMSINYTRIPFREFEKQKQDIEAIEWDESYIKFLVNSEGCGYPPRVNCTEFATLYSTTRAGQIFPCYYSRAYPRDIVIERYSWEDNLKHLILSLIIPNVIFAVSIGVLSYWYCPCCDKACHKSTRVYAEKYPNKEDKLLCRSDEEDDELDY